MDNPDRPERRLAWTESCCGSLAGKEKKAYRNRFALTDGMVSRDQDALYGICNCDAGPRSSSRIVAGFSLRKVWLVEPNRRAEPTPRSWMSSSRRSLTSAPDFAVSPGGAIA